MIINKKMWKEIEQTRRNERWKAVLTLRRQVHLALAGEEVVALPLALELGRELLRRDASQRDVARLWNLFLADVLIHYLFYKSIIRIVDVNRI